jgi:para-nitrobenzyl esterase
VGEGAALGPNWPKPPLSAEEAALSDAMLNYWVSFVRTGVPTAPGETAWPRFSAQERGYLDIDQRPTAQRDLQSAAFAGLKAWSMSAAHKASRGGWTSASRPSPR